MRFPGARSVLVTAAMCLALSGCGIGTSAPGASVPSPRSGSHQPSLRAPKAPDRDGGSPDSRSRSELRRALLTPKALSHRAERTSPTDERGTYSSSRESCRPLVELLNARQPQGSIVHADQSLAAGERGPFVDQTLHAMDTAGDASAYVEGYRRAVQDCTEVTVSYPGVADSVLEVGEEPDVSAGDTSVALSFHAAAGDLEGFDFLQVLVQSADVVVSLRFVATSTSDAEHLTKDAVARVRHKLGDSSAS